MKTSKTLRLLINATIMLLVVGALWWVVGYTLGKTIMMETGGGERFRIAYGFRDEEVVRLFLLALLTSLVRLVAGDGPGRWLRVAGTAGVAALVVGGGRAEALSVALFVFAAAAVAEAHATEALVAALVGGAIVALAAVLATGLGAGHQLLVIAVRDVFFYAPLLFGPELLDSYVWKKAD
jgi:hypothetical protein